MDEAKPARRSAHRTQWAAQFAVASELCKRGYEVAFTMGNHPNADLLIISPGGASFAVDVKGLYTKNVWAVKEKPHKSGLYYVLAFVPNDKPNQFFILTQEELNSECGDETSRSRQRRLKKGYTDEKIYALPGIPWAYALKYQDKWSTLPV